VDKKKSTHIDSSKAPFRGFGGIKEAKFRQKVTPGDTLRLEVEMERLRSKAGYGKATAYLGDKVACQCEIMFAIGS